MESNYNNSKGVSYTFGFFILIGLASIGLLLSGAISLLVLSAFAVGTIKESLNNPQNAGVLRLIQVASVIITMMLPAFFTASILNRKPLRLLGFTKETNVLQVVLVVAIMLASLFVAGGLGALNKDLAQAWGWGNWAESLERTYNEQVVVMLDIKGLGGFLLSIFIMALLPAICEEMLFRGGLQNFLTRATKKPWLSIIVVSILFSIVHFSVYGFLVRFFLGMVLGYIFYSTGSIWLSITAHFFNNALAVSAIFFMTAQGKSMKEAMNKDISATYWGLLALPIIIGLLILLVKSTRNEQTETTQADHGT